jgi:hypothetical protein
MSKPLCEHIHHNNGIHEIKLYRGTRQGVDCYVEIVGALFHEKPEKETLRYILNASECDQLPPIKYFVDQSNAYQQAHPYIGPGRLVVMYKRNTFWSIVSRIVNMLNILYRGTLVLKMFEVHERDEAIQWLLLDN